MILRLRSYKDQGEVHEVLSAGHQSNTPQLACRLVLTIRSTTLQRPPACSFNMYLNKTLICAVTLVSTASRALSAPIVIAGTAGDLVLRGDVPEFTRIYTRISDNAIRGGEESVLTREQNSELPHPRSKYCKLHVSGPRFSPLVSLSYVQHANPLNCSFHCVTMEKGVWFIQAVGNVR